MNGGPIVVKVGGSLFDLPDLGVHLRRWLESLGERQVLLVPGGGAAADVVRQLDRTHQLGDESSHWLALRAMTLNAHFLAALLPEAEVITSVTECGRCWRERALPILDAYAFAHADEPNARHLPHTWDVTSDSVAARVSELLRAREVILLKSVSSAGPFDVDQATRLGIVDGYFAQALAKNIGVRIINFRASEPIPSKR